MDTAWEKTFRVRMNHFREGKAPPKGAIAVSVKVRVSSGCFHREHSPEAFVVIDSRLARLSSEVEWIEHESGPEILVYAAVVTAGITLAKSVIELVTAVIKARTEGIKKGDKPEEPLELIVRRVDERNQFSEEIVLRIGRSDSIDSKTIDQKIQEALRNLAEKD